MRKHILLIVTTLFLGSVASAQNFHVKEDFNTGSLPTGWTTNAAIGANTWSFGIDGSSDNAGNNNFDGTSMAFFDDDNLTLAAPSSRAELISPVFDNSANSADTRLEFDYNFKQYSLAIPDSFSVEVFDGTAWVQVFSTGTDDCGTWTDVACASLPRASIDISAYANAACQVRFIYDDGNDWAWYVGVDNVEVFSPFPNDIGVNLLVDPVSSCGLTATQTVQVQIINYGTLAANNFNVAIDTNGQNIHSEPITTSIAAGDSMLYTFTGTIDLSRNAFYNIDVYTLLVGDQDPLSDTLSVIVESEPIFTPTFTDDFEGADRWKVSGTNASWERGTPSSTLLSTVTSGTNAYVTNLNGNYNASEISYLTSPCFSFAGGIGDPIVTFNLNHRIEAGIDSLTFEVSTDGGVTWQVVPAGGVNPTNWFTSTIPHWDGNSGGWIPVENVLTGLAGQGSVNFRFKLMSDNRIQSDGVGIDDFAVRYPQPIDISLNSINYPSTSGGTPICGYATESIIVELENKGANQIDTVFLYYQIDNLPVVADTLITSFLINTITNFSFSQTADFSVAKSYDISVWAVATNDGFTPNDSVLGRSFTGGPAAASVTLPFFENFDGASWVSAGQSGGPTLIPSPWVRNPNNPQQTFTPGNYTWHPWNSNTGSFNTGPANDHTGGGKYMFVESSTLGPIDPTLETPCINLGSSSGAIMEFWYHKFGATMGNLIIEVNDGSSWTEVLRIDGETHFALTDPWTQATVNLNQYAGQRIKVRWRATGVAIWTSDMAIDDVEIFEPIPQDAKLATLVSPVTGCTPSGAIIVEIENFGSAPLTNIPLAFSIDNGSVLRDSFPGTLAPGDKANHTFSLSGNFTQKTRTYNIQVWSEVVGDINLFNDRINVDVTNTTRDPDYIEDFEGFTDGDCGNVNAADVLRSGWTQGASTGAEWHVQDMGLCGQTPGFNTGPNSDHTSGIGNVMYLNGTNGEGRLESPCIDFKSSAGAAMRFWYHKFGGNMTTLFIDVFVDGAWVNGVDDIPFQTHVSEADPWLEWISKFNQFGGKDLQVRFRAGGSFSSQMAIDDISFFAPVARDARMLAVTGPETGCDINGASLISVEIDNFGVDTLNPTGDSLLVFYQIDDLPAVGDTLDMRIFPEQSVNFTFTQPADLSIREKTYFVKAWTAIIGENDVDNDTLFAHKIKNGTKVTNYFEDFELFRDSKCDEKLGQVIENGWAETSTGSYNWQVQSSLCGKVSSTTPTALTGPSGDRTTGNGMFLFVEGDGTGTATLESPCLDLTTNIATHLSFFYHKYGGNMNTLSVDVLENGIWINGVNSIVGQTQTSSTAVWKQQTVDLSAYTGSLIQIRFRSTKTGTGARSDMAIDDIFLYEPISNDAGVTEVLQPSGDACNLTSGSVEVKIENFGTSDINPGELVVEVNNNNGAFVSETIQQTILAGASLDYTFAAPMDLSSPGRQLILARTVLLNDTLHQNNFAFKTINNRSPGIPRYVYDFEDMVQSTVTTAGSEYNGDDLQGFIRSPANGGLATSGANPTDYMWHVVSGAAPSIDGQAPILTMVGGQPTGPSGDHTFASTTRNGAGTYVLIESNIEHFITGVSPTSPYSAADATLELPCGPIDLSTSKNGSVLFSYWYHMFGSETGNLFVDVHNGTNWVQGVNVIRGQQQGDDTERWKQRQVVLDQFVGLSNVRVRIRAEDSHIPGNDGSGRGGDIAVDDIEILDRENKDASMVAVLDPVQNCGLGISERFRVRLQNKGMQDILKLNLGYQIAFTPFGGSPIAGPIVKDSIVGQTVVPLAFYDFSFQNIDMAASGSYEIKVWTEYDGDAYLFNDTLVETIDNITRPFQSCEDFSGLVFDDIPKNYANGLFPINWEGSTQAYAFKASIAGNTDVPELVGHTGGLNDIFLLAFDGDGQPGQQARIQSPCWDLTNTPAANLEFWYVLPSAAGFVEIEARRVGGAWTPIDTLTGQESVARVWRKYEAVLADFVGDFVEFRFITTHPSGGYFALDDVCVIEPKPQQILFSEFVNPTPGRCFYGNDENVIINVRNIGIDIIDSFRVVVAIDEDIIGNPRGSNGTRDTVWLYPNSAPPFFNPGDLLTVTMNQPGLGLDLSAYKDYYVHVWLLLEGDCDTTNNISIDNQITHLDPGDLPYVQDFEGLVSPPWEYLSPSVNGYDWALQQGQDIAGVTGPSLDHTLGPIDTTGTYLVSKSAAGDVGELIGFQSECISLQNTIAPEIKYWYHMFGFAMGNLYLQINDDFGWVTIDQLSGEDPDQVRGGRTPWKSRIISLAAYRGRVVKFRFISERGGPFPASNMAIDDISVYDVAAKDIAPAALNEPNTDTTQCYSETNPLRVDIINNGSQAVDFTVDTAKITVIIFKEDTTALGAPTLLTLDTLCTKVSTNTWVNPSTGGAPEPLPRDSIFTMTMDSTFDMSDTGWVYSFIIIVEIDGDIITSNNQIRREVLSQRKIGQIVSVLENDTVCFGTPVQVAVRNHFGAVVWEENRVLSDGSVLPFSPSLTNPNNRKDFVRVLDTTTDLRVRMCPTLFATEGIDETTDSVRINIVKPYKAVTFNGGRCENDFSVPDSIAVSVQSNISYVNYYRYLKDTTGLIVDTLKRNVISVFDAPYTLKLPVFLTESDTFLAETVIRLPSVGPDPDGLTCISQDMVPADFIIGTVPNPILPDTLYFCVNPVDTLSQVGQILDGGQVVGREDTYKWTITRPNGTVDSANTQTVVIDPVTMRNNPGQWWGWYSYQLEVISDSGCTPGILPAVDVYLDTNCITAVNEVFLEEQTQIYPNPVSNVLTISHTSLDIFNGSIFLMSAEGKLLESFEELTFGQLNLEIDMGTLPKGVYFIKMETERGIVVRKVVKS